MNEGSGNVGVRETTNQYPVTTTVVISVLMLGAIGVGVWQFAGGSNAGGITAGDKLLFFSDDDGKTWFTDERTKLAPFDHNGKKAYQAMVYTCDGGKTKFVAYLMRYTPELKAKLEQRRANPQSPQMGAFDMAMMTGVEIKASGTGDDPKNCIKQSDRAANKLRNVGCKNGGTAEPVMPE